MLDNFEHVVAAAGVVRELLGACPHLKVLVTSRATLHIAGEQEYPLAPLRVPDASVPSEPAVLLDFAAVRLFVERAQAVRPDFRLTGANTAAVAGLCTRLDGLPLAIELAAARTRLFPPVVLLRRLEQQHDVLQEERGDRPDRHRRLSQAIVWSHDLLKPEAQRVFRCLSVFRGGFTLEAAEAVCGGEGVIGTVESLLDHNLVHRRDAAGEPRFGLLETIRSFARERLAEALGPGVAGGEQIAALDGLDAEYDNLRAALRWSERHDPLLALRLGAALWRFWIARGHLGGWKRRSRSAAARATARGWPPR